ncbi:transposase [Micromonospora zhanjiangensis]|uniref:Transposase n=1 Tax=Micromonospora zhanjiangensis TaxID=1522057 RepID=A0ABV8KHV0_9ACTN
MLATVRPRDAVGKARRRVAAELISDLERVYRHSKEADKELKDLVASTGTTLMDLHGIGPSGAARLLVEVGGITRFPNRAHFASWNGTAPIDATDSSVTSSRPQAGSSEKSLPGPAATQLRTPIPAMP